MSALRQRGASPNLLIPIGSTAIRIGDAATAILRKTKTFPTTGFGEGADPNDYDHIGVEPMLLALSMELALKAWFVLDYDDPKVPKTHDLDALFERLKPESQGKLDTEFKRSVAPFHPSGLFVDYGIGHRAVDRQQSDRRRLCR